MNPSPEDKTLLLLPIAALCWGRGGSGKAAHLAATGMTLNWTGSWHGTDCHPLSGTVLAESPQGRLGRSPDYRWGTATDRPDTDQGPGLSHPLNQQKGTDPGSQGTVPAPMRTDSAEHRLHPSTESD